MKKIIGLVLILFVALSCYADNKADNNQPESEIRLDRSTPYKEYKLQKPDYHNEESINNDDTDIPLDFVKSPLQLLRQYQTDNY